MKVTFHIASASLILALIGLGITLILPKIGSVIIFSGITGILMCVIAAVFGGAILAIKHCVLSLSKGHYRTSRKGIT